MKAGIKYLVKEVLKEKHDLNERLQNKTIDPMAHAIAMDMIRFFEARIQVAKLKDKEEQ